MHQGLSVLREVYIFLLIREHCGLIYASFPPSKIHLTHLRSLWHLVFHIFLLLVVILLFQVASKDSAEVLISVSKLKVATCLAKKTLDELHSALSYRH